jgi:hypothetical protein
MDLSVANAVRQGRKESSVIAMGSHRRFHAKFPAARRDETHLHRRCELPAGARQWQIHQPIRAGCLVNFLESILWTAPPASRAPAPGRRASLCISIRCARWRHSNPTAPLRIALCRLGRGSVAETVDFQLRAARSPYYGLGLGERGRPREERIGRHHRRRASKIPGLNCSLPGTMGRISYRRRSPAVNPSNRPSALIGLRPAVHTMDCSPGLTSTALGS